MTSVSVNEKNCDVLVIGAGAGGLSTAITAKKHGLDVIIIEKEPFFGGTMAFSGGVLWIPGNRFDKSSSGDAGRQAARLYLHNETGDLYDSETVEAFLEHGPRMLDFFERETEVKFIPTLYPDYHSTKAGGSECGRSILAAPYDATELGSEIVRLRRPLETITFIGMMFNSSNADIKHFFNATRSLTSFTYVTKRLVSHLKDLIRYRRGVQITSGNALAARLAKTVFDLGIPLLTSAPAKELLIEDGKITGAVVGLLEGDTRITARRGVVLACGGFPHDLQRIKKAYSHVARGGVHVSPTPEANTGDGIRLAEDAGGCCEIRYPNAAAWMPVSRVPRRDGSYGVFPHLLDRCKPGVIAVNRKGQRFCNEANSYHDVGAAIIDTCKDDKETVAWLICDHRTIRKYGLGYAKPAPVPIKYYVNSGYLYRAATLQELAESAQIDPDGLVATVSRFNADAISGEDQEFGRGATAFNRYLADPDHKPNPCVAPIQRGPFYALKIVMGDLGTFDGLVTDVVGRVIGEDKQPIPGLYAVGNDRASMMGGNYPGAGITLGPIMTFGYITARHLAGFNDCRQ
ncbi:FAD-dependent oxidoreductase [Beijerinckia mobilis]|uniref:FAD-dependent oxidoreductase n=1 Tax=Beijerinckia mobilis TaxID=231434 RepID=UPI0005563438|nr:FAD-dependent oxidoreductase [Beijerinckia mobilis]